MDIKRDCRRCLTQHKSVQFKDNLFTNIRQSGKDRAVCVPNLQKRPDPPWGQLSPYPVITDSAAHR